MSALQAEQLFWLNIKVGEQGTKLLEHTELILLSGPEIKVIYMCFSNEMRQTNKVCGSS